MQLAAMPSVNYGIIDLGIPWTSPVATPRKLQAMIWERQQGFECLQSSDFDGTD